MSSGLGGLRGRHSAQAAERRRRRCNGRLGAHDSAFFTIPSSQCTRASAHGPSLEREDKQPSSPQVGPTPPSAFPSRVATPVAMIARSGRPAASQLAVGTMKQSSRWRRLQGASCQLRYDTRSWPRAIGLRPELAVPCLPPPLCCAVPPLPPQLPLPEAEFDPTRPPPHRPQLSGTNSHRLIILQLVHDVSVVEDVGGVAAALVQVTKARRIAVAPGIQWLMAPRQDHVPHGLH